MGSGDWLMATAEVRKLSIRTGKRVVVLGANGRVQWDPVFENNPRIVKNVIDGAAHLVNAPGVRPYIEQKTSTRWVWKEWDIEPGEVFLTPTEQAFGRHPNHRERIVIEPNTKVPNGNKSWPWARWQEVVNALGPSRFVQVGTPGTTKTLKGVQLIHTRNFRLAMSVLANSRAFVGTEGGLHHAAAALSVPAVVLFSEYISPEITGYSTHRNIRHAGQTCGSIAPCESCRISMAAISVEEVVTNLKEIIA